ncbi:uncharacterized protein LOC142929710 [Petromyzon marinus]|uniref:uncharacterized protein LOC142929710 n=1 Tax=Petromyzon marinus TaxID=7757 RepID=UPI003F70F893
MGNAIAVLAGSGTEAQESTPRGAAEGVAEGAGGGGAGHAEERQRDREESPCSRSVLCVPRPDKSSGCWTCCDLPAGWSVAQACDLLLLLLLAVLLLHLLAWPLLPVARGLRLAAVAAISVLHSAWNVVVGTLFSRQSAGSDARQGASAEATGRASLSETQVATVKACVAAMLAATDKRPYGEASPPAHVLASSATKLGSNGDDDTEEVAEEEIVEEEINEEITIDEMESNGYADGFVDGGGRLDGDEKRKMFNASSMAGNGKRFKAEQPRECSTRSDGEEAQEQSNLAMLAHISEKVHLIMENQRDHKRQLKEMQVKAAGANGQAPAPVSSSDGGSSSSGGSAVLDSAKDAKPGTSRARSAWPRKNR